MGLFFYIVAMMQLTVSSTSWLSYCCFEAILMSIQVTPGYKPVYLIPFVLTDMTYHAVWFICIYIHLFPFSFPLSLSLCNLNPFLKLHLNIYFALFIQLARE